MRKLWEWFKEDILLRVVVLFLSIGLICLVAALIVDTVKFPYYARENGCYTTGRTNDILITVPMQVGDTIMLMPSLIIEHEWYCEKTNESFWR